ncbi:MAG: hypothetical protein IJ600_04210 [Lachnospiraceae bacterium]|nr:hypothetical protein [Lachnospiraceae bacterium]
MDIVSIECPKCAGEVRRKKQEYFAKCPYCGTEVCFNEIREEAQVTRFREQAEILSGQKASYEARVKELKHWEKMRNIFMVIITVCNLIGWCCFGYATEMGDALENEVPQWIGMLFLCVAFVCLLIFIPILGGIYPDYDLLTGEKKAGARIKMSLKLIGVTVLLCMGTIIIAVILMRRVSI